MHPNDATNHPSTAGASRCTESHGSTLTECECKFLLDDDADIDGLIDAMRLDGAAVEWNKAVNIVDVYRDTPDWRLFASGWAYRWRDASGRKSLSLKSLEPSQGLMHVRQECEQSVAAFAESDQDWPAGPVTERLGEISPAATRALFRIDNHRKLYKVRAPGGATIELAIDDATVTAIASASKTASGRMHFRELELELRDGSPQSLRRLADSIRRRFALLPSRLSKYERGLQAVGLEPPFAAHSTYRLGDSQFLRKLGGGPATSEEPAIHLAYRVMIEQFRRLRMEEPRAYEGLDPEGVHQMRVAIRRLRAAFRAFRQFLPATRIGSMRRQLKWVASALGEVRDLDVQQADLKRYCADAPPAHAAALDAYAAHLNGQTRRARKALIRCLTSRRYGQLMDRFARFLRSGPSRAVTKAAGGVTSGDAARTLIGDHYRHVVREGRRITNRSPDAALHALRIRCKRLRYVFEFLHTVYGRKLDPHIRQLAKLQDVLGEFHDACVAVEHLTRYADGLPRNAKCEHLRQTLKEMKMSRRRVAKLRRKAFRRQWKHFNCRHGQAAVLTVVDGAA